MGPWQSFVLEMTKVVLSWPAVFLIAFLVLIRKAEQVSGLIGTITDRVRKVSISRSGVHIETVPRGKEFVEEVPYREKPPDRGRGMR